MNGPKSAGRERGLCCGVQEHLPGKTQWVFCCIACPVGSGLVPAEIISVPLLQPHRTKAKSLTFIISGEGHLPRVRVLCPGLHNRRGEPGLCFERHLLGGSEKLPLVLCNDGIVPVQVSTCSGNALLWEPVHEERFPKIWQTWEHVSEILFKQMTEFCFPGREFFLEM